MSDGWQEVSAKSQQRSKTKLQTSSSGHARRPLITNSFICDLCCDDLLSVSPAPKSILDLVDAVVMSVSTVLCQVSTPETNESPFAPSLQLREVTVLGRDVSNLVSEYELACSSAQSVFKLGTEAPAVTYTTVSLRSVCYPALNSLARLVEESLGAEQAQDIICPLWPHISNLVNVTIFSVPKHEYQSVRSESSGKVVTFPFFSLLRRFSVDVVDVIEDQDKSVAECSLGNKSQFSMSTLQGRAIACVCDGLNSPAVYQCSEQTFKLADRDASKLVLVNQYAACLARLTTAVHALFRVTSAHSPAPSPWWGWTAHAQPDLLLRLCQQGLPQVSTLWTPQLHCVVPICRDTAKTAVSQCQELLTDSNLYTLQTLSNNSTSYYAAVARALAQYVDDLIRPYAHMLIFDHAKLIVSPVVGVLQQLSSVITPAISKLTQVLHRHKNNTVLTTSFARLLLSILPVAFHSKLTSAKAVMNITLTETLLYLAATPVRVGKKKQHPSSLYLLTQSICMILPNQNTSFISQKALFSTKQHSLLSLWVSSESSTRTQTTAAMLATQYLVQMKDRDVELAALVFDHALTYITGSTCTDKLRMSSTTYLRYVIKNTLNISSKDAVQLLQSLINSIQPDTSNAVAQNLALLLEHLVHNRPDTVGCLSGSSILALAQHKVDASDADTRYVWFRLCASLGLSLDVVGAYKEIPVSSKVAAMTARYPNICFPGYIYRARCALLLSRETTEQLLDHADPAQPELMLEIINVLASRPSSVDLCPWTEEQQEALTAVKTKAVLPILEALCMLHVHLTGECRDPAVFVIQLLVELRHAPILTTLLRSIAEFYNSNHPVSNSMYSQIHFILTSQKDKIWNAALVVATAPGFFSTLLSTQQDQLVAIFCDKIEAQNLPLRSYVALLQALQKLIATRLLINYHSLLRDLFTPTPVSLDDSISLEAPSRSAQEEKVLLLRSEIAVLLEE